MDDEGSLRISGLVTIILVTVLLGFSLNTTSLSESQNDLDQDEKGSVPVGFINLTTAFNLGLAIGLVAITYFIWVNTRNKKNSEES